MQLKKKMSTLKTLYFRGGKQLRKNLPQTLGDFAIPNRNLYFLLQIRIFH